MSPSGNTRPRTRPSTLAVVIASLTLPGLCWAESAPLDGDDAERAAEEEAGEEGRRNVEWIIDGSLGLVWLGMVPVAFMEPRTDAVLGPRFRGPENADELAAAVESGRLDQPYSENETVSDSGAIWLVIGALTSAWLIGGVLAPSLDERERNRRWYGEQALAFTVGMAQTVIGTYMLTLTVKIGVGRLRPDFADRADRYYCHLESIPEAYRSRCDQLRAAEELGPPVGEDVVTRGRRSFWSGHAANSWAALTYASLYIGGRMVWGRSATATTRALGILCQGAALAAAVLISQSRVSDGVHHQGDVWVGSLVGFTIASLSYWLHFDRDGEVREGISLQAAPIEGGVAAAVTGVF